MHIVDILEDSQPEHALRKQCLKIQTGLIELLPDDFDVNVSNLFSSAGLYRNGKHAVRVRHASYTSLVNGELYVFPKTAATIALVYTYKGKLERHVTYDSIEDLATDIKGNVQTDTI